MAVRTHVAGENHAADLRLVPWVPDHRTQLGYPVRELTVVAVWTLPRVLPLVAQLCFEHPLVVHVELQRLLLSLSPWHVHPLLCSTPHVNKTTQNLSIKQSHANDAKVLLTLLHHWSPLNAKMQLYNCPHNFRKFHFRPPNSISLFAIVFHYKTTDRSKRKYMNYLSKTNILWCVKN